MPMFGGTELDFAGLFPSSVLPACPSIKRTLEGTACSLFFLSSNWPDSRSFFNMSISETRGISQKKLEVLKRIFSSVILSGSEQSWQGFYKRDYLYISKSHMPVQFSLRFLQNRRLVDSRNIHLLYTR